MDDRICYFNGDYIRESEVRLSLWDTGLIGGGAYEAARTYNHAPYQWKEHIDRLFYSLRSLHIDPGLTPAEVYDITLEVFKRNEKGLEPEDDCIIMYWVSRGAMPNFYARPTRPTVIVYCINLSPVYEIIAKNYQEGIHLVVANTRQMPLQCLDPRIKHTNRLCNNLADFEAKMVDPQAFALVLDIDGFVCEGPRQNVFMVKDRKLLTPKLTHCLGGITRATILELAKELKIECAEEDLTVYDMYNADEIFITATSFTIYPVVKFNERVLEKPFPGAVTKRLFSAFSKKVGVDIVGRVVNYTKAKKELKK